MMKNILLLILSIVVSTSSAFTPISLSISRKRQDTTISSTQLHLFENLGIDKVFEDSGPLGKGITVGKVQVALQVSAEERTSPNSIFGVLEKHARNNDNISSYDSDYEDGYGDSALSKMCHEICLSLLRSSDNWISAGSQSEWYKADDAGKAESTYNLWGDRKVVHTLVLFYRMISCTQYESHALTYVTIISLHLHNL